MRSEADEHDMETAFEEILFVIQNDYIAQVIQERFDDLHLSIKLALAQNQSTEHNINTLERSNSINESLINTETHFKPHCAFHNALASADRKLPNFSTVLKYALNIKSMSFVSSAANWN